jgi:hypothetical protein
MGYFHPAIEPRLYLAQILKADLVECSGDHSAGAHSPSAATLTPAPAAAQAFA